MGAMNLVRVQTRGHRPAVGGPLLKWQTQLLNLNVHLLALGRHPNPPSAVMLHSRCFVVEAHKPTDANLPTDIMWCAQHWFTTAGRLAAGALLARLPSSK